MRGYNEYIGARYVPVFDGDWNNTKEYEPLMIVSYQGNSYTSKTFVPNGVAITDEKYWALTGNYNAQVETYRQEVAELEALFNNNSGLITIDKSVTSAINEAYLTRKLECRRYGSLDSTPENRSGQSAVYYGGFIYLCGSPGYKLRIVKMNKQLQVINVYDYEDITCHANSMFEMYDKFYILDSTNSYIIVVNIGTMSVENTITTLASNGYYSSARSDDLIYLKSRTKIGVYNSSFVLQKEITLENTKLTNAVPQDIYVENGYIYSVYNQPNVIVVYNMNGDIISYIDIGVGDGFYPYGEIETIFKMDGNTYMMSGFWLDSPRFVDYGVLQVFECGLTKPLGNNSKYGQEAISHKSINVNASATRVLNPTGASDKPFTSLFEASMVFNYLYREYGWFMTFALSGSFNENDIAIFVNCNIDISANGITIDKLYLYNCNAQLHRGSVTNLYVYRCNLVLQRMTIANFTAEYSTLFLGGSKFVNSVSLTVNNIYDAIHHCIADISNISMSANQIFELPDFEYSQSAWNSSTGHVISTLVQKHIFDYLASSANTMRIYLSCITANDNISIVLYSALSAANKTAINGGGTVSRHNTVLVYANQQNLILNFDLEFTKEKIKATNLVFTDLSGNAVSYSCDLYGNVIWETRSLA